MIRRVGGGRGRNYTNWLPYFIQFHDPNDGTLTQRAPSFVCLFVFNFKKELR